MSDFISLSCPSCGARLQVNKDTGYFTCDYCGVDHLIKADNNIISLGVNSKDLQSIKESMDKTTSELAIKRLINEIQEIEGKITRIRNQKFDKSYGYVSIGIAFIGILTIFSGFGSFFDSQFFLGFLMLIFGALLFLLGYRLVKNNNKMIKDRKYNLLSDINNLEEIKLIKREQLENHKKIVSS